MAFVEAVALLFMAIGALGGVAFLVGLCWRIALGGSWVTSRSYELIHRLIFIGLALLIGGGAFGLFVGSRLLAGR